VNGTYNFTISNFEIKEVGISSSGFDTAVNEPVVPQVPLMRYNQKMLFDGVDDYVSLGGDVSLANDFTIGIWASTLKSGSNDFLGHASDVTFIRTDTGNNRLRIRNTSGSIANLTSLTTPTDGSIFHLVLSRNSGVITAYLNGAKTGNTPTIYGTLNINEIGNVSGNTEYDGLIFSVSIFNSAFTETEAQELFNDGVAYDATTHSKASALKAYWRNDGVTTWKNRGDKFASFDGVDDVIIRNAINVDYKSISLWVRPNNTITTTSGTQGVAFFHNWSFGGLILGGNNTTSFDGEIIMMQENESGTNYKTAWVDHSVSIPSDSWSHIALVWDGSKYKIYFNGYSKTLVSADGGHVPLRTNKAIRIGHMGASASARFDGDISHFAIWSESLTDAQVLSIYNAGQNGNIASIQSSDLELYYTFNPHASTDADTNASVQDRSGNNNDSNSITGAVIDRNGTVSNTPDSITIREGLNSNRDGLGFYFTNSSNNVLRLNGVDEFLEIDDSDVFSFGDSVGDLPFTISAWIKPRGTSALFRIVDKSTSTSVVEYNLSIDSSNKCTLALYDSSTSHLIFRPSSSSIVADQWTFITATYNGSGANSGINIYINDALNNGTASSSGSYTAMHNTNSTLKIGIRKFDDSFGNGLIDELRIYNKELSLAEVQKNYKHQKGKHKND